MKKSLITAAVMVLCLSGISFSDVIVKSSTDVDMMGMGKIDIEHTQYMRQNMVRNDIVTEMTGNPMAKGPQTQENTEIVRLDKGVSWLLNPAASTYNERELSQVKGMVDEMKKGETPGAAGNYEWQVNVKGEGDTATVAGYKAKILRAQAVGVNKDNPKDTVFIDYEQYFGIDTPAQEDFSGFSNKYKEVLGVEGGFLSQMSMNPLLSQYRGQLEEISEKVGQEKGFPLKTVLNISGSLNPLGEESLSEQDRAAMQQMGFAMGGKKNESGHYVVISMINKVDSMEKTKINDAEFEVPEGYTEQ
jgi:hypothetical protein